MRLSLSSIFFAMKAKFIAAVMYSVEASPPPESATIITTNAKGKIANANENKSFKPK